MMKKAILVAIGLCLLSVSADAQMCSNVVTFALADASGVHPPIRALGSSPFSNAATRTFRHEALA